MPCREIADDDVALAAAQVNRAGRGGKVQCAEGQIASAEEREIPGDEGRRLARRERDGAQAAAQIEPVELFASHRVSAGDQAERGATSGIDDEVAVGGGDRAGTERSGREVGGVAARVAAEAVGRGEIDVPRCQDVAHDERAAVVGDRHRSIERLVWLVDAVAVEVRHAARNHGSDREVADAVARRRIIGRDVLDEDAAVGRAVGAAAVAGVDRAVVAGGRAGADIPDADGVQRGIAGTEVAGVDRHVAVGVGAVAAAIGIDVAGGRGSRLRGDGADAEVVAGVDLHVATGIGGVISHALRLRGDGTGRKAARRIDGDRRIRRGIAGQMPCREIADKDVALAAAQIDAAGSGRKVQPAECQIASAVEHDAARREIDGLVGGEHEIALAAEIEPIELFACGEIAA